MSRIAIFVFGSAFHCQSGKKRTPVRGHAESTKSFRSIVHSDVVSPQRAFWPLISRCFFSPQGWGRSHLGHQDREAPEDHGKPPCQGRYRCHLQGSNYQFTPTQLFLASFCFVVLVLFILSRGRQRRSNHTKGREAKVDVEQYSLLVV